MESWKPLEDYPGYEVSDQGNVRRIVHGGKTLRPFKRAGYVAVRLRGLDGLRHDLYVHVLVAGAFLGPCPAGMEIDHSDSDKSNNTATNLAYMTHLDNARKAPHCPTCTCGKPQRQETTIATKNLSLRRFPQRKGMESYLK